MKCIQLFFISLFFFFFTLCPLHAQIDCCHEYNFCENGQIHGYVSQGYVHTTDNNYFTTTKNGSFAFHEAGLNITYDFSDCFRTGVQFYNRQYGRIGSYDVRVDWAYGDYRFNDSFGIRFGKMKVPYGLHNQWRDLDVCRTFAILPQGVYTELMRDYIAGAWGVGLYGHIDLCSFGGIDYEFICGYSDVDVQADAIHDLIRTTQSALGASDAQNPFIETEHMLFGGVVWNVPWINTRLGITGIYGTAFTGFDFPALVGAGHGKWESTIDVESIVYSAEWSYCDFVLTGEYSIFRFPFSSTTFAGPGIPGVAGYAGNSNKAWYISGEYCLNECTVLGAYYSEVYIEQANRSLRQNHMKDITGTVRYDINSNWIAKFELHNVRGYAYLSQFDNPSGFSNEWMLGIFKLSTSF